jgi:serine/threonine-protein phosphatase PGAM5
VKRTIILVRHGQYEVNTPPGIEPDGPLTALGRDQARATGKFLKSEPIDIIHHSTMRRAMETASIIGRFFPDALYRPSNLLRECVPARPRADELTVAMRTWFQGLPREALQNGPVQAQASFKQYVQTQADPQDFEHNHDDGENIKEVTELIVAHGNLLSYFVSQVFGAPGYAWMHTDFWHCGISRLVTRSNTSAITLMSHNETAHLPVELRTK